MLVPRRTAKMLINRRWTYGQNSGNKYVRKRLKTHCAMISFVLVTFSIRKWSLHYFTNSSITFTNRSTSSEREPVITVSSAYMMMLHSLTLDNSHLCRGRRAQGRWHSPGAPLYSQFLDRIRRYLRPLSVICHLKNSVSTDLTGCESHINQFVYKKVGDNSVESTRKIHESGSYIGLSIV